MANILMAILCLSVFTFQFIGHAFDQLEPDSGQDSLWGGELCHHEICTGLPELGEKYYRVEPPWPLAVTHAAEKLAFAVGRGFKPGIKPME